MPDVELCNDGRCSKVRMGEDRHSAHTETNKFSEHKWKQFQVQFWGLMMLLTIVFTGASWNDPESISQKIAGIMGVLGVFVGIYVALWTYKTEYLKKRETERKTKHAKEEIYSTLRSIAEIRKERERIRRINPHTLPTTTTLEIEIRFMNHRLKRIIESLQFVLLLNSEYLSPEFTSRTKDAVSGYDFILNRLDVLPFESDDPMKVLAGNIEHFIEELKTIK